MPEPIIQALPTLYGGVTFRSRLEARWAVFMDHIQVRWMYEPEGFALPCGNYLPDFQLPKLDCFLEIKPICPSDEERRKAHALSAATRKIVFIQIGQPKITECFEDDNEGAEYFSPDGGWDNNYLWCECPHCGRCELQFNGRADRIKCNCPKSAHGDKGYSHETDKIKKSVSISISHRFGT